MIRTIVRLVLQRLLVAAPILVLVSMLLFGILRLLPVDPAAMSLPPNATSAEVAAKRAEMGLDRTLPQQYAIWLEQTLHGDFGTSIQFRRGVGGLIGATLPATLELSVIAMAIATVAGLGGGLVMFRLRGTAAEAAADLGSIVLLSLPDFLWALFLILLFGVAWTLLPFTGRLSAGFARPGGTGFLLIDTLLAGRPDMLIDALRHMVLPCLALGIAFAPAIMRVLRSSLLDVYQEDYIRQARLRGVGATRILLRHALKNAALPTLGLMSVQFGFLFGGTLLVEVIYSYPGMGNLMVDAVRNADLPVIQAVGLVYCVAVLVISTALEVLHALLDPRLSAR